MTTQISLTNGLVALVDDADAPKVTGHRWSAIKGKHTWYAASGQVGPMHTLLTGFPITDHINGNGLDNRRENLRSATDPENKRNAQKFHGRSRYKGVTWVGARSMWRARIARDHLGYYADETDAAKAYDAAARVRFGSFATVNFPLSGERSAVPT